jgi:hypothetical protein
MSEQIRETEVVKRWGVPKEALVDFRNISLVEGRDWERLPQGRKPLNTCPVVFTEDGLKAVMSKFGLIAESGEIAVPASKPTEEISEATVVRVGYPNKRIMLVSLPDGKRVFCNVFDSTPFKPELKIVVKFRGGRYYCEHRPTSILRINSLLNRNTK